MVEGILEYTKRLVMSFAKNLSYISWFDSSFLTGKKVCNGDKLQEERIKMKPPSHFNNLFECFT